MTDKNEILQKLGQEVLSSTNLTDKNWKTLSVIADINEGHFSQSGFLYTENEIEPFTVKSRERKLFSNLCKEFKQQIYSEIGHELKQLLIQVSAKGEIKVDFEFDDPNRWAITPANLKLMQEEMRPIFD